MSSLCSHRAYSLVSDRGKDLDTYYHNSKQIDDIMKGACNKILNKTRSKEQIPAFYMFTNKNISMGTNNEQGWYWQRGEGKDVPGQHGKMTETWFSHFSSLLTFPLKNNLDKIKIHSNKVDQMPHLCGYLKCWRFTFNNTQKLSIPIA